jgi:hypothetical protein
MASEPARISLIRGARNVTGGARLNLSRRLDLALSILAAAIALWVLITTVIIIQNAYFPIPLFDGWDHWRLYLLYGKYSSFLFVQHNEHRIALARVFFYIDHSFFRARSAFVIICNSLIQALTGYFLYQLLHLSGVKRRDTLVLFGSFIACCLFSSQQFTNLTWAFQIQFVAVYCTAVGSILALQYAASKQASRQKTRLFYFSLACFLAVLSTYSMANGLILWPILVLLSFWLQMPRSFGVALMAGTVIMSILYLWDYHSPGQTAKPMESVLHHLPTLFTFSATYLGAPIDPLASLVLRHFGIASDSARLVSAATFGAAGALAVALLANVLGRGRLRRQPAHIALLHVLFFILATSVLVGMGRVNFPLIEAMTSRYVTPAMVFWVALVSLVWSFATPWLEAQPGVRAAAKTALVLAILLGVGAHQNKWIQYSKDYAATVGDAQAAVAAGVYDQAEWHVAYHTPTEMFGPIHYLARNQLSVFSEEWTQWTGLQVASRFVIGQADACLGHFDESNIVATGFMPGSRVSGWAWDVRASRGPKSVVLVDQDSRIAGVARNIVSRPDVAAGVPSLKTDRVGWRGYIAGVVPRTITAYMVLRDGKSLCPLGSLATGTPLVDQRTPARVTQTDKASKNDAALSPMAQIGSGACEVSGLTGFYPFENWGAWSSQDPSEITLNSPLNGTVKMALTAYTIDNKEPHELKVSLGGVSKTITLIPSVPKKFDLEYRLSAPVQKIVLSGITPRSIKTDSRLMAVGLVHVDCNSETTGK